MLKVYRGYEWTPELKKSFFGEGAKSTEFENYQRTLVEQETVTECAKLSPAVRFSITPVGLYDERVELITRHTLDNIHHCTENFDGRQVFGDNVVYVNFKFIVGGGGNQTSRLRDVGVFIKTQMKWLDSPENDGRTYFANILDGERCSKGFAHFHELLTLQGVTESFNSRIYVGDLHGYSSWLSLHM